MKKQAWICSTLMIGLLVLRIGAAQAEIDPATAQKLLAKDGVYSDEFGGAVSVSGDTALIGAWNDDDKGEASGSAYVFVRSSDGKWKQQAKLTANDGAANDMFGMSVSLDGDTALIGATYDDDKGDMSGAAYVFVRSSDGKWKQQAKLIANDGGELDFFGCSVSLDGDTALIGAWWDNITGSAYIFVRSEDGTWTQKAKLTADDGADHDGFGNSVSLEGNIALIGAAYADDKGESSGSAYIFVRSSDDTWTQQTKLTAADGNAEDIFGESVSVSGGTALIGAWRDDEKGYWVGSAYIFMRSGDGAWTQQAKLTVNDGDSYAGFGKSVAVEGDTALIGTWGANSVYVFVRSENGASWTQQTKLTGNAGSIFGYSVSLDSSLALVGVPWDDNGKGDWPGSAYIYITDNDADNDGIINTNDKCPNTVSGDVVNSSGCSIVQICPCDSNWKNRSRYMQCVQQASRKFLTAKLITKKEWLKVNKAAVKSRCGQKSFGSIRILPKK